MVPSIELRSRLAVKIWMAFPFAREAVEAIEKAPGPMPGAVGKSLSQTRVRLLSALVETPEKSPNVRFLPAIMRRLPLTEETIPNLASESPEMEISFPAVIEISAAAKTVIIPVFAMDAFAVCTVKLPPIVAVTPDRDNIEAEVIVQLPPTVSVMGTGAVIEEIVLSPREVACMSMSPVQLILRIEACGLMTVSPGAVVPPIIWKLPIFKLRVPPVALP